MKPSLAAFALTAAAALATTAALAQPAREAKLLLLDLSSEALIDAETAKGLLKEGIPAKVWRLYPQGKWTFLSQVEGGLTRDGICVVTAQFDLPNYKGLPVTLKSAAGRVHSNSTRSSRWIISVRPSKPSTASTSADERPLILSASSAS